MKVDQAKEADFTAWVAMNQSGLEDFTAVVCGSPVSARPLLVDVLARALLRWNRIGDNDTGTLTAVRRMVIGSHRCPWLRVRSRVRAGSRHVTVPGATNDVWHRIAALPRREREVLAARLCTGMDVDAAADLLHLSRSEVLDLSRAVECAVHPAANTVPTKPRRTRTETLVAASMAVVTLVFLLFTCVRGYPHTHLHGGTFLVVRIAWMMTLTAAVILGIRSYLRDGLRGTRGAAFCALSLAATVLGHVLNR